MLTSRLSAAEARAERGGMREGETGEGDGDDDGDGDGVGQLRKLRRANEELQVCECVCMCGVGSMWFSIKYYSSLFVVLPLLMML